jgi:nitroimidazol reductase NimA-like FMN-containing flavoprotein (pyridoxamine 5'-phosphate oxidase superfamily)
LADAIASETAVETTPATALAWSEARTQLADTRFYWLATVRADGGPHVRPMLGVWVDGAFYTTSNPTARKAKNLHDDGRCAVTARTPHLDIVVEGSARQVSDDSTLQRVADAYNEKYRWPATVKAGAFDAPYGAPTAGPPPYELFELTPTTVFAFGTDDTYAPQSTRYRF